MSGPSVNVSIGGVHVCDAAEAVRLFRAGYGVPTDDSKDDFAAALAEQEQIDIAEAAAAVAELDAGDEGNGGNTGPEPDKPQAETPTPTPTPEATAAPVAAKPAAKKKA